MAAVVIRSILASGGALRASEARNSSTAAGGSLDLGEHPVDVVADQAAEPEAGRERVHERPEAHSLDDPLDADRRPDPLAHPSSVATGGTGRT